MYKNQRGGDIDILIISQKLSQKDRIEIKNEIFKSIEEQKIDMIIAEDDKELFVKLALSQGVRL